ncbi:hypothetical protein FHP25_24315 [Vineibacter terrae]|uniref:Transcription elongation factor GreA/GreB C-terminal domain-containing protein n=1 Tax=Vineibacter terrae TaxID=2586908 RepID=A0A5C8PGC4_9HYPH|nr:GreA/GreB family elongation factor [Vineibacter terrae]TXL72681.1 hypothetical protein FHP25_24315 [Vineibacter terrae]
MIHAAVRTADIAPEIIMTERDHARLDNLLREHASIRSWKAVVFLTGEMKRARIIADDEIDETVVTLHTRVAFLDDYSDEPTIVTLTLPGERGLYVDAISVLTPPGAALLGLSEGQSITYAAPDGGVKTITVTKVLFQPQAVRTRTVRSLRGFSSTSNNLDAPGEGGHRASGPTDIRGKSDCLRAGRDAIATGGSGRFSSF